MSISYPTVIDNFDNPTATTNTTTVSHADQHANANDAIEALEAKVGVNSSAVATSLDYKVTSTSSSNPGHKHTLANGATDVTASAAELNIMDGVTASTAELNILDGVTSSAAELNILDGVTASAAEINVLDGITASTAELNKTDGVAGNIVGTSDTQTLTNKRVTKRVLAITSSATPTVNTDDYDVVDITAQSEAITSMTSGLSGTPTNKQTLIYEIKDNGSPRAITWGTSFEAGGVDLPTTTVASKILTVGFMYSTANSLNKWRCIASQQEA